MVPLISNREISLLKAGACFMKDFGSFVTIIEGVLPAALRGPQKSPKLVLILCVLKPVVVRDDRATQSRDARHVVQACPAHFHAGL